MSAGSRYELSLVHWEDDPKRTREVVGFCKRCYPEGDTPLVMLVAPRGMAHQTTSGDTTDCGRECTGPEWWHRT